MENTYLLSPPGLESSHQGEGSLGTERNKVEPEQETSMRAATLWNAFADYMRSGHLKEGIRRRDFRLASSICDAEEGKPLRWHETEKCLVVVERQERVEMSRWVASGCLYGQGWGQMGIDQPHPPPGTEISQSANLTCKTFGA